jgi:hypothetical protein
MRKAIVTLFVAGCGGAAATATPTATPTATATATATPTPTATPTATATATATATSSATPPPPATGGSVLIGEIAAPKSFDPKSSVVSLQPQLLACYNQARATNPSLRGKLKVRFVVNEAGTVINVDAEPGGTASDEGLVSCISSAARAAHFPKPAGTATVLVPLVFRQ